MREGFLGKKKQARETLDNIVRFPGSQFLEGFSVPRRNELISWVEIHTNNTPTVEVELEYTKFTQTF